MVIRTHHGLPAVGWRFRLSKIRRLPAIRSWQFCQQGIRCLLNGHQRRRLSHPDGLLFEGKIHSHYSAAHARESFVFLFHLINIEMNDDGFTRTDVYVSLNRF